MAEPLKLSLLRKCCYVTAFNVSCAVQYRSCTVFVLLCVWLLYIALLGWLAGTSGLHQPITGSSNRRRIRALLHLQLRLLLFLSLSLSLSLWQLNAARVPHTHSSTLFHSLSWCPHCCCCLLDWMLWILFSLSLLVFVRRILHPLPLPILHHPLSVCCTEDVCVCVRTTPAPAMAPKAAAAVFMSYAAHLRCGTEQLWKAPAILSFSLSLFRCLSSKIDVNPFDNINFVLLLLLLLLYVHYR